MSHISDHPEIRDDHEIMRRIFNSKTHNNRPYFKPKEINSEDYRANARALFFQRADIFQEAGISWKNIRAFMKEGFSDREIVQEARNRIPGLSEREPMGEAEDEGQ